MAALARSTTRLYSSHGTFMGPMAILPQIQPLPFPLGEELRISHASPPSERCFPLAILHTISSQGVLFKMEPADQQPLSDSTALDELHAACLKEAKTAVVVVGGIEIHLAAMNNAKEKWPCFWGFLTTSGLYNSCLTMLNLRCLSLVFDLDETLIVANTMRSFEDRIEALERRIRGEVDSQKLIGISAELKRYREDKMLLKQYIDHDHVWDVETNKLYNSVIETVPPLTEAAPSLQRPIIRLQQQNMIFTRINPNVRDTSVLVRIRPAWGELRSYLTARGRKRFEVYVCTMSEKDYALEMWRLLDPEAKLINPNMLIERVTCVKSGSKKSLENVFLHGRCHQKLALVIDDRLKVWEDIDRSHVHVVPAFAPYYAPQAEMNCNVPILCVARNIVGNVRSSFFKDFDDGLLKKMSEITFDTDVGTLPQRPDVVNYLAPAEESAPIAMANDMKDFPDGMTGAEVEIQLRPPVPSIAVSSGNSLGNDVKLDCNPSLQHLTGHYRMTLEENQLSGEAQFNEQEMASFQKDLPTSRPSEDPILHEASIENSPVREEGEVPESELDPDTRRRLLILQHGQDTEHPRNALEHSMGTSFPLKLPLQLTIASGAPAGGWLGSEEEQNSRQFLRSIPEIILDPEVPYIAKQKSYVQFLPPGVEHMVCGPSFDTSKSRLEECASEDRMISNPMDLKYSGSVLVNVGEAQFQTERLYTSSNPVTILQDIAQKCNTKVEFKPLVITTKELQFSVEVVFGGDKVGGGVGRTKKEAQHRAAEDALRFMASQYISNPLNPGFGIGVDHFSVPYHTENNSGQPWNSRDPRFAAGLGAFPLQHDMTLSSIPLKSSFVDFKVNDEIKMSSNAISVLKDWGTVEGVNVIIRESPSGALQDQDVVAQVEIAGEVIGKGSAPNYEAAKERAAEEALKHLKIMSHPWGAQKRVNHPRSDSCNSSKRPRAGECIQYIRRSSMTHRHLTPGG